MCQAKNNSVFLFASATFVPAPSLHLIVLYYIQLWEFEYLF
jgi:hypothetical protein